MSYPDAARRAASVSRSDEDGEDRTFPRASRLRSRKLFLDIYQRGQRVSGKHFVIFGLPGATPRSRLGITATKRLGSAVTRNRIKRLVRDVFRNHRRESSGPIDLVVNIKPTARDESTARLAADLVARLADLRRRLQP